MKPFFISTSIPYVNGSPHIGFTLEALISDSIARFQRSQNRDTFFLTGTDEHGMKIHQKAAELQKETSVFCDELSAQFEKHNEELFIQNDGFIRTTDQKNHWPSAQKLWSQLEESGDIYKKSYEGNYCVGCEMFYQDKDVINNTCPIHKKELEKIAEENYFFKLSKYSDAILEKIESKEVEIVPEFRKNEIVSLIKEHGLKDISFSRNAKNLPWGIPVPSDKTQNMYVWCDALTNYISALDFANNGELYQKFWEQGEKVHVIGKDIVRFHAGFWLGMLLSAKLPLPNKIIIHGFITNEGEKMSKSLGNVINPSDVVEKYSADALRYFLLSQIPSGQDYDYTEQQFINIYNSHLANNLGNFLNRVHVLCSKNNITPEMRNDHPETENMIAQTWEEYNKNFKNFDINKSTENILQLLQYANKKMDEEKPWTLVKSNPEDLKNVLPKYLELCRHLRYLLEPIIPSSAKKIETIFGFSSADTPDTQTWNAQKDWKELGEKSILFPRYEK